MSACRVCGCTDFEACTMPDGSPCFWVEADLGSACAVSGNPKSDELLRPILTAEAGAALVDEVIYLRLDGLEALMVLGSLQLASRCPDFEGVTRDFIDQFSRGLADRLAVIGPEIGAICEAGFKPEFDVPAKGRIIAP